MIIGEHMGLDSGSKVEWYSNAVLQLLFMWVSFFI